MKWLSFLRHGEADHPGPATWSHDSRRPLTEEGRSKIGLEAEAMKLLGISIDEIVTSPYVRARQTADEVARVYRLADRMTEAELLEPGGSFKDLRKALRGTSGESVLVVGHAPDLGVWVGELTGTNEIRLGKGAFVLVRLDEDGIRENGGRLRALLPADLLIRLGRLGSASSKT